jgi:diguanylate cyclase (GGDEF)-like protein
VPPETVAVVGINITALVLLAYVAMVIAREQRRARDAAIRLSTIDPLTGLFNRTFFFAAVEREIARSARSGRGFCLLMMDLDELKQINDRHGHFFGDRVLRGVGEVIRAGGRRIDTSARYGGDEFVVLLPETDPTGAYVLAEKIRLGVADLRVDVAGTLIQPSVSIGVVSYPDDGRTSDELMITADSSMYHSKRAGKNRVTGVPLVAADLLDEITPASSPRGESPSRPAAAVVSSGRSRARPAAAERSDKSV